MARAPKPFAVGELLWYTAPGGFRPVRVRVLRIYLTRTGARVAVQLKDDPGVELSVRPSQLARRV